MIKLIQKRTNDNFFIEIFITLNDDKYKDKLIDILNNFINTDYYRISKNGDILNKYEDLVKKMEVLEHNNIVVLVVTFNKKPEVVLPFQFNILIEDIQQVIHINSIKINTDHHYFTEYEVE